MPAPSPTSGAWRIAGRRLGDPGGPGDEFCALVHLAADGTLSLTVDDVTRATGIGGWSSAGHGRVVARAELFVAGASPLHPNRVVVRAAAELSADGAAASVRLQWQLVGRHGEAISTLVACEGRAERLEP